MRVLGLGAHAGNGKRVPPQPTRGPGLGASWDVRAMPRVPERVFRARIRNWISDEWPLGPADGQ